MGETGKRADRGNEGDRADGERGDMHRPPCRAGTRRPAATARGTGLRTSARRYPRSYGLVLDQQIVEFAALHALDQSGDLSPGVDEGGAFGVA